MSSSSVSDAAPRAAAPAPRWVRAVDLLCLVLVLLALAVAMSGGFRQYIFGWRLAVTSPYPLLLWALGIGVARHFAAPAVPVYRDLPLRIRSTWHEPAMRAASAAFFGTRPAMFIVGYLAVVMIGYATGPEPPLRAFNSELLNLPIRWDAGWYMEIVSEGYSYVPNHPSDQQTVAFFPAYPLLMRGLGRVFGGHLAGYVAAGLVISLVAFFVALVYVYALARDTLGDDDARFAVWLLAAYPFALFFGGLYTEALFLAGVAGAFYHFTRGEFGRSFAWGVLVGLTKTNGFLLSVPLGVLALGAIHRYRRAHLATKAIGAAAGPGVGMLIFSAYIWQLTGNPLTWLRAHEAWGRKYQGLAALVGERYDIIERSGVLGYVSSLPYDMINALGVLFVLAAAWPVARRMGLAYAVLILVMILPPLAAGGLVSAGRFSSVLFPAFVGLAAIVPPRQRAGWIASFAALQALNAALFYTWRPLN